MCKGSVATFLWDRFCEFSKLNAPQSNYYSMSRFSPPNRTKRDADMSRDDTGFARVLSYPGFVRLKDADVTWIVYIRCRPTTRTGEHEDEH